MSLINQMLKDLDEREGATATTAYFGDQVSVASVKTKSTWRVRTLLAGLAVGIALVLFSMWAWPLKQSGPVDVNFVLHSQLPLRFEFAVDAINFFDDDAMATDAEDDVVAALPLDAVDAVQVELESGPLSGSVSPVAVVAPEAKPAANPISKVSAPPAPVVSSASETRTSTNLSSNSLANTSGASAKGEVTPALAKDEDTHPSHISKEPRQFTVQQQAENEFRKATIALQQGKQDIAIAGYKSAVALDPAHSGARQTLIGLLVNKGLMMEAMEQARAGLAVDEKQTNLAMILGRLQLGENKLEAALATLKHHSRFAQDRPDYLAFLAALLQRDQNHLGAVSEYKKALLFQPENGLWWMGLGMSQQALDDKAAAVVSFTNARNGFGLSAELAAFVETRLQQLK